MVWGGGLRSEGRVAGFCGRFAGSGYFATISTGPTSKVTPLRSTIAR